MKMPQNPVELRRFLIETGITQVNANYSASRPVDPKPKMVHASRVCAGSSDPKWGSWSKDGMKNL
jgi:hypothetical protein